ncbi:MAG: FAD-dependent oxidoreductase [Deltaproteobacteria bacterium]|nr:FAD-dependent oxidoreductase [Deltaproteobacteria bacterium]
MGKKHLIIGTGSAALSALESLRGCNREDEVTLVTREPLMPYSPTALPFLLSERIKEADLWLRDGTFFEKLDSTLVLDKEAVKVVPDDRKVIYGDGTEDRYDTLLLATGSRPVLRDIKGLEETGYITFHTFYDYRAIRKALEGKGLKSKGNVVIYGGGLVAAELAIPLIEAGYGVEIVVRSRLLRSYVNPRMGARIENILKENGAVVHQGCVVDDIAGNADGTDITLSNGRVLHSRINILMALGVEPAVSFLEGSGIEVNEGIVVDDHMRTSKEGIYAAGDVAEAPEFFYGKRGLSGILPSAVRQGKVAGVNMGGGDAAYPGWIPMNMFNFFGHVVFSVGLSSEDEVQVIEDVDSQKGQCKELCFQEEKLVGARFLDVKADPGVFLYLIENRVNVEQYKDLLLEKPRETSRWLMLEAEKEQSRV